MNKESEYLFLRNVASTPRTVLEISQGKEQLIDLIKDSFGSTYDREKIISDLEKDLLNGVWVAAVIAMTREQAGVGYGILNFRDNEDHIWFGEAYVSPQHRRKGVYKRLVEERLTIVRELGVDAVSIEPSPYLRIEEDHTDLQRKQVKMLKRHGFRKDNRLTPLYTDGFDSMVYTKKFNAPSKK